MRETIVIIDILAALGVIGLVLLQQGKGADMGAAFGSGASQTLFGARGSANFLTRATAVLATVFFLSNIALAYMAARSGGESSSVIQQIEQPKDTAPQAPAPEQKPDQQKLPEVPK
jgi:preprotein translocase subunit SecG